MIVMIVIVMVVIHVMIVIVMIVMIVIGSPEDDVFLYLQRCTRGGARRACNLSIRILIETAIKQST